MAGIQLASASVSLADLVKHYTHGRMDECKSCDEEAGSKGGC